MDEDKGALAAPCNSVNGTLTSEHTFRSPAIPHSGIQARYPELFTDTFDFLTRVTAFFGADSRERRVIYNILDNFKAGKVPKSEVFDVVMSILINNDELKAEWYSILDHQDARWGPTDFPMHAPVPPGYLQPQHQLQLPMPSFWGHPTQSLQSSTNPELLYDTTVDRYLGSSDLPPIQNQHSQPVPQSLDPRLYGDSVDLHLEDEPFQVAFSGPHTVPLRTQETGNVGYESSDSHQVHSGHVDHGPHLDSSVHTSSPTVQPPQMFPSYSQHTSSTMHPQVSGYSNDGEWTQRSNSHPGYAAQMTSPICAIGSHPQRSSSLRDAWITSQYQNGAYHKDEAFHTIYGRQRTPSPTTAQYQDTQRPASPHQASVSVTPSLLRTPLMASYVEPSTDVLSMHRDINSKPYNFVTKKDYDDEERTENLEESTCVMPVLSSHFTPPAAVDQPAQQIPRDKGHFIHQICGKGFTMRRSVKKHHWGPKMGDLETTAGCWARNGKPNVAWDAHPTCQEQAKKPRVIAKPTLYQEPQPQLKAPKVPSMLTVAQNLKILPDFPALDTLPQKAAESLQSTPTSPHFPFSLGDRSPNYSSQRPTDGPFESLLTAVNVASRINAPTPQGRNDSVVFHLNARAASVDLEPNHTMANVDASHGVDDDTFGRLSYESSSAAGLGITHLDNCYAEPVPVDFYDSVRANGLPDANSSDSRESYDSDKNGNEIVDSGIHSPHSALTQVSTSEKTRKRHRARSSGIRKQELRGLELDASPALENKRRRTIKPLMYEENL